MLLRRFNILSVTIIVIPSVIFAIHALLFSTWVVDDAGITFAYARNFAQGYGLVSQPGMSPVEGYSNFAWLIILSPFFLLNGFDPVITPKVISFLLVIGTFIIIYQTLESLSGRNWIAFAAFSLTSLNTSFVVWTISGLENPLYLFLVSVMLWWSIRITDGAIAIRKALWIGVVAALIGMTRPDGLAYVLAFPAILIPTPVPTWKQKGILLLMYGVAFVMVYGPFIVFRLTYFGVPLPNTYYMKGGLDLQDADNLLDSLLQLLPKARNLLQSIGKGFGDILPPLLLIGSLYLMITRYWTVRAWAILVFTLCSLSIYLLLQPDWMGEYRFATIFFPLFYLFCSFLVEAILRGLPPRPYIAAMIIATALTIITTFSLYAPRSEVFRQNPTVPLQYVRTTFVDRFDRYKQTLELETASVLLPDVGAMIYYADLIVYDLAGLTDQTVARYLGTDIYRPGFYDYIFEDVVPTFIHSHGFWTYLSRLEDDPRFAQLYVSICAYTDPWIEQNYGVVLQSGDFVLRSIAQTHPNEVNLLQQELDANCNLK
jgi:hypothetical protein